MFIDNSAMKSGPAVWSAQPSVRDLGGNCGSSNTVYDERDKDNIISYCDGIFTKYETMEARNDKLATTCTYFGVPCS